VVVRLVKLLAVLIAAIVGVSGFTVTPTSTNLPSLALVKKTIAVYYGDPGTGKASSSSPYAAEVRSLLDELPTYSAGAAIVVDVDDTMLLTYNMEVGAYDYDFDRSIKDRWIAKAKFPAVPGMVDYLNRATSAGFRIFAVTGRDKKYAAKTKLNLTKLGYPSMTVYGKNCDCTTVEFKAGTRKAIEKRGYDIALNIGDQFSDLQGGYADETLKLPNPMYFVGTVTKKTRTTFELEPDGSSGLTAGGEGIPNFDLVARYRD